MILAALAIFAIIMTQTPLLSRAREKGEKVHTAAREYRTQAFRQREDRRQKRKLAAEAREKQRKKQKTERELEEISKNSEFSQQRFRISSLKEMTASRPRRPDREKSRPQRREEKLPEAAGEGAGSGQREKAPQVFAGGDRSGDQGYPGGNFFHPRKKIPRLRNAAPFSAEEGKQPAFRRFSIPSLGRQPENFSRRFTISAWM